MAKQVEFHHGVLPQCLAALCHEKCEQSASSVQKCHDYAMSCVSVQCIQELIKVNQIQSETPMVQQGSQLSEWTEGLRTPAVLWQWPQGLQLFEWTEGLRTHAILWQWPFQAPGRICKFQNDQACSAS